MKSVFIALLLVASVAAAPPKPKPTHHSDKEVILALDRKVDDLAFIGDKKGMAKILAPDFSVAHGDPWTVGDQPFFYDNRTSYLERTIPGYYTCRTVGYQEIELHHNVAYTYGWVISGFKANIGKPNAYFTIRYLRLWERKGKTWEWVSQRAVRGPINGATPQDALDATSALGSTKVDLKCPRMKRQPSRLGSD